MPSLSVLASATLDPDRRGGLPDLAQGFGTAAGPEGKPLPTFGTWETLFAAASGRGPDRAKAPA